MAESEASRPTSKRITDPRELRALSHPLRIRLVTELLARGQASVTQLANAVGEPVNRVSYHLRQLGKYDLIEEAPELARDGRDRWWRPLYPDGIDWSSDELRATPAGRKVVREREENAWGDALEAVRAALRTYEPGPGRLFCHDWFLRATPEQFRQFDREYIELRQRWRDRVHQEVAEGDDAERRTYAIFIYGFPAEIFGRDTAVEEGAEP